MKLMEGGREGMENCRNFVAVFKSKKYYYLVIIM